MTAHLTALIQPRDTASLGAGSWGLVPRAAALLKDLGPYAAIELLMPGGSLLALLLWLYRRRKLTMNPVTFVTPTVRRAVVKISHDQQKDSTP
jgi:hypothetical protein